LMIVMSAGFLAEIKAAPSVGQHDVMPVLLRRCMMCHGPTRADAGLDLRSRAAMLKGGQSGPAMVLKAPGMSRMIQRIREEKCPPKESISRAGIEQPGEAEVALLEKWIELGAPMADIGPDVATTESDDLVTDDDRRHWAFRPPRKPAVPKIRNAEIKVRNEVDAFLAQGLIGKGLKFSPEADRLALLRRATFNLTGLPPSPAEIAAFEKDSRRDPDSALRDLVDRLLASPRYGERWGRFWLDLAGYADSEGKRNADMVRPYAWKYRDYVIQSFNTDKPYDQFLREQIAGDEMVDYSNPAKIDANIIEKLVATGFLRMAPDGTSANPVNRVVDRLEVVADEIDILSAGVIGITLKCARCHDHKYDPIPQRDYYRFVAIFKGGYDEYDWLTPQPFNNQWKLAQRRHLDVALPAELKKTEAHNAKIDQQIKKLEAEQKEAGKDKKLAGQLKKKIDTLKKQKEEPTKIRALWDRGKPSPTYIYKRGDPMKPSALVGPGVPSVLTDGRTPFPAIQPVGKNKTGRRLALAHWITRPDHPLTARVIVNRVWKHHFGEGIVRTIGNFGQLGTPPTHPELLDWLAVWFVENGWSIKKLHRLIMTSTAYRQSSEIPKSTRRIPRAKDPDNKLLSRMPLRRMDAEEVRDAILAVAGRLDVRMGGKFDEVDVAKDGLVTSKPTAKGRRRSIYIRHRRKEMPTILETFDLPQMNPNCVTRINSTVVSQPLHLLNNRMIHDLAGRFAERVRENTGDDTRAQTRRAWLLALNRPPTIDEEKLAIESIESLTRHWTKENAEAPANNALADFCHTLLNSAAFLYID
jgi:hypothetical protein